MANKRYKVIKVREHESWLAESPVKIEKSQLSFDRQSNKLILQVKLFNLGDKKIKSVFLDVNCFDDAMDFLCTLNNVAIQGVSADPQTYFGDRQPIVLGSSNISNTKIIINKVVFADESVWRNEGKNPGVSLPEQKVIDQNDPLYEQVVRECSEKKIKPVYWFESEDNYWRCICGQPNKQEFLHCGYCQAEKDWLIKHFDKNYLTEANASFLELEEVRKGEEKKRQEKLQEKLLNLALAKKKKQKKLMRIVALVCVIGTVAGLTITKVIIPVNNYKTAVALMDAGNYETAVATFTGLGDYKDSKVKIGEIANKAFAEENYMVALTAWRAENNENNFSEIQKVFNCLKELKLIISAGRRHTIGLKNDGTVLAVGSNEDGQCNVSEWKDITAVSAGDSHTVGLKSDGTVVAVGSNGDGQCEVSEWKDITAVSAGDSHSVGLKSDGTVVAVGSNFFRQCNVSEWKDIVAVFSHYGHTVGLKSDGTVLAIGANGDGQCDVSEWKDIVAVAAGSFHTVGLKNNGTFIVTGYNGYSQCDVSEWNEIGPMQK